MSIYKREFLIKNDIKYSSTRLAQDVPFMVKAWACADTISILNKEIYNYRKHPKSSSAKITHWEATFTQRKAAYEILLKCTDNRNILNSFLIYYIRSVIGWYKKFTQIDPSIEKGYYNRMHKAFNYIKKTHPQNLEEIIPYIRYGEFCYFQKTTWVKKKYNEILRPLIQSIFSLENTQTHKIITILGIKIKLKRET